MEEQLARGSTSESVEGKEARGEESGYCGLAFERVDGNEAGRVDLAPTRQEKAATLVEATASTRSGPYTPTQMPFFQYPRPPCSRHLKCSFSPHFQLSA